MEQPEMKPLSKEEIAMWRSEVERDPDLEMEEDAARVLATIEAREVMERQKQKHAETCRAFGMKP